MVFRKVMKTYSLTEGWSVPSDFTYEDVEA